MARNPPNAGQTEKNFAAIVNQGYFSDYFLAYRLDVGLAHIHQRWDDRERNGDPTPRTSVRGLGRACVFRRLLYTRSDRTCTAIPT